MRVLPEVSRSTVSRSVLAAGGGDEIGGSVSTAGVARLIMCVSVGHCVEEDVDSERIGRLFSEMLEVIMVVAFPFPTIAVVGVVGGEHHDPAFIIEDGAMMGYSPAFFPNRIIWIKLLAAAVFHIRDHVFGFDVENAVIQWMVERQFDKFAIAKYFFEFGSHVVPFALAPEIVHPKKSAVEKVFAQHHHFFIVKGEASRFDHIDEGIVFQLFLCKVQESPVRIYFQ